MKKLNILVMEVPFDEITPEELAQYENDPNVEIEVDGDSQTVFILKKQY
ncbi:MAG: hypothetical protein N2V75_00285 [Methanophagales archaeon]|nr:hypothetical protein [Methanophagales archaeon]